ncbi:MAG: M1 family metallopeptidase [candidate division Zixibacteria bacterium]|nr:M1 family metallopeptidase [candidate division Zixibacteria bacterium]
MIGSNQVEYPWLDESITNFFTQKIFEFYWGDSANLFDLTGFKTTMRDMNRLNMTVYQGDAAINQPSYSYYQGNSYFSTVYDRGALAVETLDNLMGDSLSNNFWRKYFDTYKFAHPTPKDFRELILEAAGNNLAIVYDILFESTVAVDFSVSNLSNSRLDSTDVEISFVLHRKGGIDYPIDYRIYLSNGDSLDYQWISKYNTEEIIRQSSYPAVSILIDPDNKWAVDANLLNNSVFINPDNKPGFRLSAGIMFLIESLLSFAGGI